NACDCARRFAARVAGSTEGELVFDTEPGSLMSDNSASRSGRKPEPSNSRLQADGRNGRVRSSPSLLRPALKRRTVRQTTVMSIRHAQQELAEELLELVSRTAAENAFVFDAWGLIWCSARLT